MDKLFVYMHDVSVFKKSMDGYKPIRKRNILTDGERWYVRYNKKIVHLIKFKRLISNGKVYYKVFVLD